MTKIARTGKKLFILSLEIVLLKSISVVLIEWKAGQLTGPDFAISSFKAVCPQSM